MRFVDNGVPEDFARLTFEGMSVPLCELTEEEYMEVVFGIKGYVAKGKRGLGECPMTRSRLEEQKLDESIDMLDLSVRADHALKRSGIETVRQLCKLTMLDLCKIRNMGEKTVKEVIEKLEKYGFRLKEGNDVY